MRKYIALLLLIVVAGCNCKINTQEKVLEKTVITTVLDTWHKNAAETRFEAYFGAMSKNSIFIGTDATENWTYTNFKTFSKPYFDKGKAWSFIAVERNIYINENGKTAWFDELLDTHMGVCRGSGVLQKTDNKWKIAHYVLSLTIPNEVIEGVKKLSHTKDSIFLAKKRELNNR